MPYLINYWFAPTFHEQLIEKTISSGPFVLFLRNRLTKEAAARIYNPFFRPRILKRAVPTRYSNSSFLGKQKSEDNL